MARCKSALLSILLLADAMTAFPLNLSTRGTSETLVYLRPASPIVESGAAFFVNVSVRDVFDLGAWQAKICYGVGIITAINVSYPSDNVFSTRIYDELGPVIYDDKGYIQFAAALNCSQPTFSGSGMLAVVEFVVKIPGNWTLTLNLTGDDTCLLDSNADTMLFSKEDCSIIAQPYPVPDAELYIDPPLTVVDDPYTVAEPSRLSVNVSVLNVFGLSAWHVEVLFDKSVLKCLNSKADNSVGYVSLDYSFARIESVCGNLTLGTVTFEAISVGNSSLQFDIDRTHLWLPNHDSIKYRSVNASVDVRNYLFFELKYDSRIQYSHFPDTPSGFFILPRHSYANLGDTLQIAVGFKDVPPEAAAWQARVKYNSTLLQAIRIINDVTYSYINDQMGYVCASSFFHQTEWVDWPEFAILFRVEFKVKSDGDGTIRFDSSTQTFIMDWGGDDIVPYPNRTEGYVNQISFDEDELFNEFEINVTRHVQSFSDFETSQIVLRSSSEIANLVVDPIKKEITYQADPSVFRINRTIDFANLIIPKGLLYQGFEVYVDESKIGHVKLENDTHVFLDFKYSHGQHQVCIKTYNDYQYSVLKGGQLYEIHAITNSTIVGFSFDEQVNQVSFNIGGFCFTQGYCNITVPKQFLTEAIGILLNGTSMTYATFEGTTHYVIFLEYNHNPESIRIEPLVVGDTNGDNRVDVKDVYAVSFAFGSGLGELKYTPRRDINDDGRVDIKDIYIVCSRYG